MSSILRALKKLENEPRHQEESPPLENKFVPSADTGTQRPLSGLLFIVAGGGIICGLVILAGWWLFSGKGQAPIPVPTQISLPDSRLEESPAPSKKLNEEPTQAFEEKKTTETPAIQKVTEQLRQTEPTGLEIPAVQIIPQEDILPDEKQISDETVPAQEIPNLKENEQAVKPAEKPLVAAAKPKVAPVEVEVPRVNDPDMNLQAITWSREPQKRIAVINNRILREGDLVSGYFINTINQDDIVISRDGEKWKLAFH